HAYTYGVLVDYTDGGVHIGLGPVPVVALDADSDLVGDSRPSIDSPKVTTSHIEVWAEAHPTLAGGLIRVQSAGYDLNVLAGTVTAAGFVAACSIHYNTTDYFAKGDG